MQVQDHPHHPPKWGLAIALIIAMLISAYFGCAAAFKEAAKQDNGFMPAEYPFDLKKQLEGGWGDTNK